MTIESGPYCEHCADASGNLRGFQEVVERFDQWTARRNPESTADEVRAKTLAFMASMPAWRDHPGIQGVQT